MEKWVTVEGFTKYKVSSLGRVSGVRGMLNPKPRENGYRYITLYGNGKSQQAKVSRLVANAFVPNPNNLPEVNHLDLNKANDKADNLEWALTRSNVSHNYVNTQTTSKYTGVSWHKPLSKWRVRIFHNKINIHLGYYRDEYEAHLAYVAALESLGTTNKYLK